MNITAQDIITFADARTLLGEVLEDDTCLREYHDARQEECIAAMDAHAGDNPLPEWL